MSKIFYLPLIPPPLPMFISKNNNKKWTVPENEDNLTKLCLLNWRYLTRYEDVNLITFYNKANSFIQQGPTCGLIAVYIISQLFNNGKSLTVEEVILKAQKEGITLHGEMFSTTKMKWFLEKTLPVYVQIKSNLKEKKIHFIKHLTKGWPILISYDVDGNHQPCLKKGHKAHWAVLLGYCLKINKHYNLKELIKNCDKNLEMPNLFHLKPSEISPEFLEKYFKKIKDFQLFLFAKQGKSLRIIIFNYDQLIESNLNLSEIDPKYVNIFNLPKLNLTQELSNQALFIEPKFFGNSKTC